MSVAPFTQALRCNRPLTPLKPASPTATVDRGTPNAVAAALADSKVRARLEELGQDIPAKEQQTPDGLAAMQKAEIEKWWPLIKAANIKVE